MLYHFMLYQTDFNLIDTYDNANFCTSFYCKQENIMWDVKDFIIESFILVYS